MTCNHCTKTALYIAGKQGFCGEHLTEAKAAMKALSSQQTGKGMRIWTKDEIARSRA
jgi:hypothetical protein